MITIALLAVAAAASTSILIRDFLKQDDLDKLDIRTMTNGVFDE